MIAAASPQPCRSPQRLDAPQVLTMAEEVEYRRLFCPHCRSFLLEACFEGALAVRIKCRQCTRRAASPVLVVIEIKLAVTTRADVHSPPEPIERDSTP